MLVLTAPKTLTAKFQVTKHNADAQSPRNKRFSKLTPLKKRLNSSLFGNISNAGNIKRSPLVRLDPRPAGGAADEKAYAPRDKVPELGQCSNRTGADRKKVSIDQKNAQGCHTHRGHHEDLRFIISVMRLPIRLCQLRCGGGAQFPVRCSAVEADAVPDITRRTRCGDCGGIGSRILLLPFPLSLLIKISTDQIAEDTGGRSPDDHVNAAGLPTIRLIYK